MYYKVSDEVWCHMSFYNGSSTSYFANFFFCFYIMYFHVFQGYNLLKHKMDMLMTGTLNFDKDMDMFV